MKLTIDFETRSPVDLQKSGAWRYAEHPDTDVMCLAVKVDSQATRLWINPRFGRWDRLPVITNDALWSLLVGADQVEAHNAEFERAVWRTIMIPRYGWPDIPDHKWRCSAAKAAAFALPRSLEGAGAALGLPIQKDSAGKKIMLKLCRPAVPPTPSQLEKLWRNEALEWIAQDPVQGAVIEITRKGGISEKLLLRDYDRDTVRDLKVGRRGFISSKSALPPDEAAADYGFGSLDDMIEAVRASKTPAEAIKSYVQHLEEEWRYNQAAANADLLWHEDREDLLALFRYCIQDVDVEHAISEALPDLNSYEQAVWHLDQTINERGILADVTAARAIVSVLADHEAKLLAEVPNLTNGRLQSVKQTLALAEYCGIKDATKACVDAALQGNLSPDIRRLLEIRQTLGKSSTSKLTAILNRVCADGRLRGELLYHGASPGRWTGKGVQLQNLPRASVPMDEAELAIKAFQDGSWDLFYPEPTHIAKCLLRPVLTAPPGKDLISADFASIEARVLLWLAGDEAGLELFRSGADIYCDMASAIFDRPVTKADKFERQVGKTAVLGLGYGMGMLKFHDVCTSQGIQIDKKLARHTVRTYRAKYETVPSLWRRTETAALHAVRHPGEQIQAGKARFGMRGHFLHCQLPSRRLLAYPYPKIITEPAWIFPTLDDDGAEGRIMVVGNKGVKATALKRAADEGVTITGPPLEREKQSLTYMGVVKGQWTRETTFGGKLVENIDQAVSRDLMAAALLRLEASGYPIVLSVHDEAVSEVPEDFGSVAEYEAIMSKLPAWAEGIPVSAEGWRGKRYRK